MFAQAVVGAFFVLSDQRKISSEVMFTRSSYCWSPKRTISGTSVML